MMHQLSSFVSSVDKDLILGGYLVSVGLWVNRVLSSQRDGGQQDEEED